jgi:hypothetical protein
MSITIDDIKEFRLDTSHQIKKLLLALKWNQSELAEKYGRHIQGKPYTRARISQLVNCNAGVETPASALLEWLNGQKTRSASGGTFSN